MTRHRLTTLRPALSAQFAEPIPSTDKLRKLMQDGRIPGVQVNHIWHYDPVDVPAIGAVLGLARTEQGAHTVSADRQTVAA